MWFYTIIITSTVLLANICILFRSVLVLTNIVCIEYNFRAEFYVKDEKTDNRKLPIFCNRKLHNCIKMDSNVEQIGTTMRKYIPRI